MQKKIKILIYCRIGEQLSRNLLDYLVDQLKVSVIQNHMDIIGVIKKISTEKWLNSFEMRRLIIPATYDEFEMYCHVHDVLVSLFMI